MIWLAYNSVSIAAIAGAVALLIAGIDQGWGWLLFIAFAAHVYPESRKSPGCSCCEDEESCQ